MKRLGYMRFATVSSSTAEAVIKAGRDIIFPEPAAEIWDWFSSMAFSKNTRPEFLLLGSLGVLATIAGPGTNLEIRAGSNRPGVVRPTESYGEYTPLYITILSEPGSGKSPAHLLAIQRPLEESNHHELKSLLIQDYTLKGLFEHLKSHDGRGLIASSEMQGFFDLLLKKQQEGNGERQLFNRLYDGNHGWTMTRAGRKADEGENRTHLSENSLSIVGFCQPQPFVEAYKPLAEIRDGFIDRLLICTVRPKLLKENEVDGWREHLDNCPIQNFHTIYEEVFQYHQLPLTYKFSPDAAVSYRKFSDDAVELCNKEWETGGIATTNISKDKRNICRLALAFHILKSTLTKFLDTTNEIEMQLSPGDIPLEIPAETFGYAEKLIKYFAQQREALNLVLEDRHSDAVEVPPVNFQENILKWIKLAFESQGKIPNFMTPKSDGFILRYKDAEDPPYNQNIFLENMKKLDKNTEAKVHRVHGKTIRGILVRFSSFKEEIQKELRRIVENDNIVLTEDCDNKENNSKDIPLSEVLLNPNTVVSADDFDNINGANCSKTVLHNEVPPSPKPSDHSKEVVEDEGQAKKRGARELHSLDDKLAIHFKVSGKRKR